MSQKYTENEATGVSQLSRNIEKGDEVIFCRALLTTKKHQNMFHINISIDHSCILEKRTDIANFSVIASKQMDYI